jgi:hypothetical protein
VDFARWDPAALADAWRAARPFAHVVLDGLLGADELAALCAGVAREPHFPNRADFFEMMASREPATRPELAAFAAGLDAARPFVAAVTGKPVARVSVQSYVYLAGSYLLPHHDAAGRLVAFAFYLLPRSSSTGGELELFDCRVEDGEVVAATPTVRIEPEANRLVLFDVTPASLHQVREVTAGARASVSGWFLP